jgi:benzoylformate decarboxylase
MERIKQMSAITTKDDTNRSFAKRGNSKQSAAEQRQTVWAATYDLLRSLKLTTFFGNPGSTELTFLKDFPSDFQYILGLQEASAVAMADGFAQATRRPALVNLHSAAGLGNGMCNIMTAFLNKTPLIITAGQQMRKMILSDPYLTNRDETMLPRPWVKWAYQPTRAQDVPGAIMRAYAMALQPPSGPVFVSIPLDDWDEPASGRAVVRTVSTRFAPDGDRLREFAQRISASKKLALIYGQEIDRSGGWDAGVGLAEKLNAPVFHAPDTERPSFPETHRLFQGMLPRAMGPLSDRLKGFDLAAVIGATVFRYHAYVPGPVLPAACKLLQVTNDPSDASSALVGDSLLGDARLTLEALLELVEDGSSRTAPKPLNPSRVNPSCALPSPPNSPLTASEVYAALSELRPEDAIVVQESPTNASDLATWWPTIKPASYYTFASGALGWAAPAAVGIALAQKGGTKRPVVAVIGDGSLQYSVQCLASAAQHKLKVIYVIPCNGEYAALKEFAELQITPNVPALDLPELDIVSTAKGFGCAAVGARTKREIQEAFSKALNADGPTLIAVPIKHQIRPLVPLVPEAA